MCRQLVLGTLLTALVSNAVPADPGQRTRVLRQVSERFDADPGWEGRNNRVKVKPIPIYGAR